MLIWGSGTRTKFVGEAGEHPCQICNATQRFIVQVRYRFGHIWYLFSSVSQREYLMVCTRCGNGHQLEAATLKGVLPKDPIPLIERKGWLIFGGPIMAAIIIAIAVSGWEDSRHSTETQEWVRTPAVGDVYLADLSKVTQGFNASPAYGAMKLVNVQGDSETFEVPKSAFRTREALDQNLSTADFHSSAYYDEDNKVELQTKQVQQWKASGVVFDVKR